jgi:hypothetical protein
MGMAETRIGTSKRKTGTERFSLRWRGDFRQWRPFVHDLALPTPLHSRAARDGAGVFAAHEAARGLP